MSAFWDFARGRGFGWREHTSDGPARGEGMGMTWACQTGWEWVCGDGMKYGLSIEMIVT